MSYYYAIASRKLFESVEKEEYSSVFTLFKHLMRSDNDNYFNWLAKTFSKIFIVMFMAECEKYIKEKS